MKTVNLKKIIVLSVVAFASSFCGIFAQQITKFGVVDTARVYQAYFRDSTPVRNYESKKQEFQSEIDKMVSDLQNLHDRKLEYEKNGDESAAMNIEAQITKRPIVSMNIQTQRM